MARRNEELEYKCALLQNLIQKLTGFEENDGNFDRCVKFAYSIIFSPLARYPDPGSHSVRRRMDGVYEKFTLNNLPSYGAKLKENVEIFLASPIYQNHEQFDIQWSLLTLLLELGNRPTGAIKDLLQANRDVSLLSTLSFNEMDEAESDEMKELIADLKSDILIPASEGSDSELSEWSDDEGDAEAEEIPEEILESEEVTSPVKLPERLVNPIQPPQRQPSSQPFDTSDSERWLADTVQPKWWNSDTFAYPVKGRSRDINFCQFWNKHLAKISFNHIKAEQISTVSEFCLLREILWMFCCPPAAGCKFFRLEGERVELNKNVSIPSVTVKGLRSFMREFVDKMTIVHRLRRFCEQIADTVAPPHTYESYAALVERILAKFYAFIVAKEREIRAEETFNSILSLHRELSPHFRALDALWRIHEAAVLDWRRFAPHECATYLVGATGAACRDADSNATAAMAFSLNVAALRAFVNLLDTWWMEGRIDDWQQEFLVEQNADEGNVLEPLVARSFSLEIPNDLTVKYVMGHVLQAGGTLGVLKLLDRVSDVKKEKWPRETLFASLIEGIVTELEAFRTEEAEENPPKFEKPPKKQNSDNFKRQILEYGGEMLLLACQESIKKLELHEEHPLDLFEPLMFDRLTKLSSNIPPYNEILLTVLKSLLDVKLRRADELVVRIYKNEFHIQQHIRNVRRVFLLESSDLMHHFYTALFQQIESGKPWANPYMLTVHLQSCLASKFGDNATLFTVELVSEVAACTADVLQALETLTISCNLDSNLLTVISPVQLDHYNRVFRFLAHIKWALWTLERLRWPESLRRRPPYVAFELRDLLLRRLMIVRVWLIYLLQCLHSHLMTAVMQALGAKLDRKVAGAASLAEIIAEHRNFVDTVHEHCFLGVEHEDIRLGVRQLLDLIYVLRDEWRATCGAFEPPEADASDEVIANSKIDEIEQAYIRCHRGLVVVLQRHVITRGKANLSELYAEFNGSIPY